MALITAAQFREHYPDLTGTGEDAELDKYIARASALLALWCGWPKNDDGTYTLEQSDYTLYPRRHHQYDRALDVGLPEMGTPTSAHIDEDWTYGSSTEVAAADLVVDERARLLWIKPGATTASAWSSSPRANKVVIPIGIVTAGDEVIAAVAMAARALWDYRRTQGRQQVTRGGVSVTIEVADNVIPRPAKEALGHLVNWSSRAG